MKYSVWSSDLDNAHVRHIHRFSGFDSCTRAERVAKRLSKIVLDRTFWVEKG